MDCLFCYFNKAEEEHSVTPANYKRTNPIAIAHKRVQSRTIEEAIVDITLKCSNDNLCIFCFDSLDQDSHGKDFDVFYNLNGCKQEIHLILGCCIDCEFDIPDDPIDAIVQQWNLPSKKYIKIK